MMTIKLCFRYIALELAELEPTLQLISSSMNYATKEMLTS